MERVRPGVVRMCMRPGLPFPTHEARRVLGPSAVSDARLAWHCCFDPTSPLRSFPAHQHPPTHITMAARRTPHLLLPKLLPLLAQLVLGLHMISEFQARSQALPPIHIVNVPLLRVAQHLAWQQQRGRGSLRPAGLPGTCHAHLNPVAWHPTPACSCSAQTLRSAACGAGPLSRASPSSPAQPTPPRPALPSLPIMTPTS